MELVVALIALLVAGVAVFAALRRGPADSAAELQALRIELNLLREKTEGSMQSMGNIFATQLQGVAANVQTALATVTADVSNRLEAVNRNVADRLGENAQTMSLTSQAMNERIASAQATFAGLQKQVGEMSEQARQLAELSRTMTALERVLSAPKLRGGFGEAQLEQLLSLVFAREQFEMQHRMSSGEFADAVLFFPQGKVVIDSKFTLENFRRMAEAGTDEERRLARRDFLKDFRRRVEEVAGKYIRPAEGTLPFALMFVPAENVYYEAIIRDEEGNDLYDYCLKRRVVPVSPNSLYAYLQTIVVGLNGMRISARAESILREIETLRIELGKFNDAYDKVGGHLRHAAERFADSTQLLDRVDNRVQGLTATGTVQEELFGEEPPRSLAAGGE
jgi:DNA recombination protein RmuC